MAIIASTTHPDIIVDTASAIPDVTNAVATIHTTEELDPANETSQTTPPEWAASEHEEPDDLVAGLGSSGALSESVVYTRFPKLANIPSSILQRWIRIAEMKNPSTHLYAVSQVPENVSWGMRTTQSFLVDGDGTPLTLWCIVRVVETQFYDNAGGLLKRVSIKGSVVFDGDAEAVRALFRKASPPKALDPDAGFYVNRLQTKRTKGPKPISIMPFTEVYDAVSHFASKDQLNKIPASELGQGDIVVLECHFKRWHSLGSSPQGTWDKWGAGLDLVAVFLLYSHPETDNAPEDPPVAVFQGTIY